jgi:hypothetical protein
MGFLDNDSITVDAILTKYGRKKLANGQPLGVTGFALSDDGVDYTMWNTSHPSGSANYGDGITALPMLEVPPNNAINMRYKLYNRTSRNAQYGGVIALGNNTDFTFESVQTSYYEITPSTNNVPDNQYAFRFYDVTPLIIEGNVTLDDISYSFDEYPPDMEIPRSAVYYGTSIRIYAAPTRANRTVYMTVEGQESGAFKDVTLNIVPNIDTPAG